MIATTKHRYAARLQFCYVVAGEPLRVRRTIEERTVLTRQADAPSAAAFYQRYGKRTEYDFENSGGEVVQFVFVGIIDLIRIDDVCGPGEVWYEIEERSGSVESLRRRLPSVQELLKRKAVR